MNKAAWAACDTFRGVVDPSIYKDYILTMLLLKYISDVWKDHDEAYKAAHGDHPELIAAMMKDEQFVLPEGPALMLSMLSATRPGTGSGSTGLFMPLRKPMERS
ncbi:type I restriction-modification system subunit M N-terminal domain-containing protein [Roseibium marinum]|uniref:HsdM-like protein n=1 Tax=Roseibium marinum TaxID=281252 RepID=A0A2S3UX00_9HYPH|nr:type I restriction-modification system subunit M N-terminal domain-containing protein [Roseibium marinum]POF32194.1 HsdM-like protein [Roseibium marinum]